MSEDQTKKMVESLKLSDNFTESIKRELITAGQNLLPKQVRDPHI